ncbi:MAG: hypothetical protein OWQ34_04165 [Thermoplasma acidophilum]|nr:hypothetical protein [Thermoplasma acidophilum]
MRHARIEDLKDHGALLESLRMIGGIKEKAPGHFYYRGKNVIHFHTDGNAIFADVGNERVRVSEENYADIIQIVISHIRTLE